MGGRNCCVKNCRRRSHDHHGRKIPNGLTFHCFPAWRTNEGGEISELTRRRRAAWVAAVDRGSITFDHIPSSMRVCSRHFHSGRPAYEMLESDPDWAPSLNLGHNDGNLRRAERVPLRAKKKQKKKMTLQKSSAVAFIAPQTQSEATEDSVPSLHLDHPEGNSSQAEHLSLSIKLKKKPKKRKRTEMRPAETFKAPQTKSEAAADWIPSLHLGHSEEGNLLSVKPKKKQIKNKRTETRPAETFEAPQTKSEAAKDWVPSLHLDHSEGKSLSVKPKKKQIKSTRTETRPAETFKAPKTQSEAAQGIRKPSVPPWTEVKTVLQSLLQINSKVSKKPEDQTLDRPAANDAELSFRDFFRNALEASLEASIRSRAQSKTASSTSEITVELNLQVPPLKEKSHVREDSTSSSPSVSSSSSHCLNCVRLQRRVAELKEQLSHFTGEQEDMEASPAPIQPDQNPESIYEIEEEVPESGGKDKASPLCPKPRPTLRFRKEWLSRFWFLRYSPSLDTMWCHVCRLHASATYQKVGLIKAFKIDSIKKHSNTLYHKENLEKYMMRNSYSPSHQTVL